CAITSSSAASCSYLRSLERRSDEMPVFSSSSLYRAGQIPKMYVSATSMRFSRGRSTPARRAIWHYPSGFTAVFSVLIPVVCFLLLGRHPQWGGVVVKRFSSGLRPPRPEVGNLTHMATCCAAVPHVTMGG